MSLSREGAERNNKEMFIDSVKSVQQVEVHSLSVEEVMKFEFANLEVAYAFYNVYGKVNGFGIRRHKVGGSIVNNTILWQAFVCYTQGQQDAKHLENQNRKKEPKPLTRCGCQAQMRDHMDFGKSRWYVQVFEDEHNHELLSSKFFGMLSSHRRMIEGHVDKMNCMRDAGISTAKIYGYFASQSGGFDKVGFRRKQMYNRIDKQRRLVDGDATGALNYLCKLSIVDPLLYWEYEVDGEDALRHLFWVDGKSQVDYEVFGDVLAFDATYGKNKYRCPLVVFSGVNHHLQTIVFASAIVSDESEGTYAWLLEKFLEVMKGKCPKSVITDGDGAMRKAIERVFQRHTIDYVGGTYYGMQQVMFVSQSSPKSLESAC